MTDEPTDDIFVDGLSVRDIEEKALAWREAFEESLSWSPDLLRILEHKLPRLYPDFALVVRPTSSMINVEAYTQFAPPQIVISDRVYEEAASLVPRARWTLAHELGHFVLHEAISKPRAVNPIRKSIIKHAYNSAEWQANKFAAHFLMPEHIASQFQAPEELAQNCNVSLTAARKRFNEMRREPIKRLPNAVEEFLRPRT
jgi:hypothetical protein